MRSAAVPKPSPDDMTRLKAVFDGAMAGLKDVEPKTLFGCDGYFVNGNIFGLVWKEGRLGLRLTDEERQRELLEQPGAGVWRAGPMIMRHWVLLPPDWHKKPALLKQWSRLAYELALERPEKPAVTRKSPPAKKVKPAVFKRVKRDPAP
jgi:TfoX/Sxy family transcriptional regulator of competence genes